MAASLAGGDATTGFLDKIATVEVAFTGFVTGFFAEATLSGAATLFLTGAGAGTGFGTTGRELVLTAAFFGSATPASGGDFFSGALTSNFGLTGAGGFGATLGGSRTGALILGSWLGTGGDTLGMGCSASGEMEGLVDADGVGAASVSEGTGLADAEIVGDADALAVAVPLGEPSGLAEGEVAVGFGTGVRLGGVADSEALGEALGERVGDGSTGGLVLGRGFAVGVLGALRCGSTALGAVLWVLVLPCFLLC